MAKYKQRISDRILKRKVLGKGAVLIEGPKWCGKTTTAKQLAKSVLDLGDSSVLRQSAQLIELSPKTLLEGKTPRLIDEWQALPPIWDSIRSEVDKRGEPSQFILTGSSVLPEADETIHSGTGRYAYIKMRPMSLYESGESNGTYFKNQLCYQRRGMGADHACTFDRRWPLSFGATRFSSVCKIRIYDEEHHIGCLQKATA